jgi:hypothetical protein
VTIHQDVDLYAALLGAGDEIGYEFAEGRYGWLQVARGSVRLEGSELEAGDGVAFKGVRDLRLAGVDDAEVLLFDMGG